MEELYLDHAASTPVLPEVAELMLSAIKTLPANPSSVHRAGQRARRALEGAREQAAAILQADAAGVTFTSGATEAINQALFGLARADGFRRLLVSPLEHKAVLAVADALRRTGSEVVLLQPEDGQITPEVLKQAEPGAGDVVACMLVNNETGALSNIRHLANVAHRRGALLFCDATQGFGLEEVTVPALQADALVLSGHKFGGPRGAGLLWIRDGLNVAPFILGGEQERGYRAGTSNLPAIMGLSLAMQLADADRVRLRAQLQELQAAFEERVLQLPGVSIVARNQPRSVKQSSVSVSGVDGEALLMALDANNVQLSIGSACSAGSLEPSHVLLALGMAEQLARSTVRVSYGRDTTLEQVLEASRRLELTVRQCRAAGQLIA